MRRRNHYYQDISNFRAPYDAVAMGAVVTQGPVPGSAGGGGAPSAESAYDAFMVKGSDGLYRFRPQVAAIIVNNLKSYGVLNPGPTQTQVQPFTKAQMDAAAADPAAAATLQALSAANWVGQQVAGGNLVFASASLALPATPVPGPGGMAVPPQYLGIVSASDKVRIKEIADSGAIGRMAPVLATPAGYSGARAGAGGSGTYWVVGLGLAAVVGVAVVVKSKKKRRSGKLNRNGRL